jgi:hypothetical protein
MPRVGNEGVDVGKGAIGSHQRFAGHAGVINESA